MYKNLYSCLVRSKGVPDISKRAALAQRDFLNGKCYATNHRDAAPTKQSQPIVKRRSRNEQVFKNRDLLDSFVNSARHTYNELLKKNSGQYPVTSQLLKNPMLKQQMLRKLSQTQVTTRKVRKQPIKNKRYILKPSRSVPVKTAGGSNRPKDRKSLSFDELLIRKRPTYPTKNLRVTVPLQKISCLQNNKKESVDEFFIPRDYKPVKKLMINELISKIRQLSAGESTKELNNIRDYSTKLEQMQSKLADWKNSMEPDLAQQKKKQFSKDEFSISTASLRQSHLKKLAVRKLGTSNVINDSEKSTRLGKHFLNKVCYHDKFDTFSINSSVVSVDSKDLYQKVKQASSRGHAAKVPCTPDQSCCDVCEIRVDKPSHKYSSPEKKVEYHYERKVACDHDSVQSEDIQTETQSKYYIVNKNKPFSYLEPDPEFELYSKKKQPKKYTHCCMRHELDSDNSGTRSKSSWARVLQNSPPFQKTFAESEASKDSDIDLMKNCLKVGVLRSSLTRPRKRLNSVQNMCSSASENPLHTIKIELMKNEQGKDAKVEEFVCIAKNVDEEKLVEFPLETMPANQIPIIRDIPKQNPKDKKKDEKIIRKNQVRFPPHKENPALKLTKNLTREELIQAVKYIETEIRSTNAILKELAEKIIASEPTTVTKPSEMPEPEPEPQCTCPKYEPLAVLETGENLPGVLLSKQAMLTVPEEPVTEENVSTYEQYDVPEQTPDASVEKQTIINTEKFHGVTEKKLSNLQYNKAVKASESKTNFEPDPECICGHCNLPSKEPAVYFQTKSNMKGNRSSSNQDICRMPQTVKVAAPKDSKVVTEVFGQAHKSPELGVEHVASSDLKGLDVALGHDLESEKISMSDKEVEQLGALNKTRSNLRNDWSSTTQQLKEASGSLGSSNTEDDKISVLSYRQMYKKSDESPINFPSFTLDQMDSLYLEKVIDADKKHEEIFNFSSKPIKTEIKDTGNYIETRSTKIQSILDNDGSFIKNAATIFKPVDLLGNTRLSPESSIVKLSSNYEANQVKINKPVPTLRPPFVSSPIIKSYVFNNRSQGVIKNYPIRPEKNSFTVPIKVSTNLVPEKQKQTKEGAAEETLLPTNRALEKPCQAVSTFNVVLENSIMQTAPPIPLIKVNIFDEATKNYLNNIVKIEASMNFKQSLSELNPESDKSSLKTINNMTIPWNLLRCYQSAPNLHLKVYDDKAIKLPKQSSLTTIQIKKTNSDGVLMELHVLDSVLQRYIKEIKSVKAKILVKDKKSKNAPDATDRPNPFKLSLSRSMHTCVTASKAAQSRSDELHSTAFYQGKFVKKCPSNNVQANRKLYCSRQFEKKKVDEDVPITLRQVLQHIEQNLGAAATDVFREKRKEKTQYLLKDPLVNFGSLSRMSPAVVESMEELRQTSINDKKVVETIQKDAKKLLSQQLKRKLADQKKNDSNENQVSFVIDVDKDQKSDLNNPEDAKRNSNYDKIEIRTVIKENISGTAEENKNMDMVVTFNPDEGSATDMEGDILDQNREKLQLNRQVLAGTNKSLQSEQNDKVLNEPDAVDKSIQSILHKAIRDGGEQFTKEKSAKKSSSRVNDGTNTRSNSNFEVEHRIPVNVAKYFENRMLELCRQRDEVLDNLDNKPKKKPSGSVINVKSNKTTVPKLRYVILKDKNSSDYSKATIVHISEKDQELGPIENFVKINKSGKISYVGRKLKLPFLKEDDVVEVPKLVSKKKPLPKKYCNKICCMPSQHVKDEAAFNPFPVSYREKVKLPENIPERNEEKVISVRLKRANTKDAPDYPDSSNDTLMDFDMTPETNPQTLNLLKKLEGKVQDTMTENTKVCSQKLINMDLGTILEKLEQYSRIKKNKKDIKNVSKKH